MHLKVLPLPRVLESQLTELGTAGPVRETDAISEVLPKVAVMIAFGLPLIVPTTAAKVAVVVPAATGTEAGRLRTVLLLDKPTTVPPEGAVCERVTVHVDVAPAARLDGEHTKEVMAVPVKRDKVALCVLLLKVPLTAAVLSALTVPTLAINVDVAAPAGTVRDAGTVKVVLLLDNDTSTPPAGAGCDKLTVQVEVAPVPRPVGLHMREVITRGAAKDRVALCEAVFHLAVTTAD